MTPYRMDSSALVLRLPAAHTQIIHQNPAYIFVEESQSEKKKRKATVNSGIRTRMYSQVTAGKKKKKPPVGFEPSQLLKKKKKKSHFWGLNPRPVLDFAYAYAFDCWSLDCKDIGSHCSLML